jgi:hypothetical protein
MVGLSKLPRKRSAQEKKDVDARDKRGHDVETFGAPILRCSDEFPLGRKA